MNLPRFSALRLLASAAILALPLAGGCAAPDASPGGSSPSVTSPSGTSLAAAAATVVPESHKVWRRAMAKQGTPHAGCFHAKHPSTTWEEVPCGAAPNQPLAPPKPGAGTPALQVGDGSGDYVSTVAGNISYAEGSFPQVSGLTNLAGVGPNQPITAAYTLQLNTNTKVGVSYCATSPNPKECTVWQQFVYLGGQLFMQYWLINYWSSDPMGQPCPASFNFYDNGYYSSGTTISHQYDCYVSSPSAANTPTFSATDLPYLSMAANVFGGGGDSVTLYYFGEIMAISPTEPSFLGVAQWWKSAEFNVFGPGYGSAAVFNYGTTMSVQTITDSVIPTTVAPTCKSTSFTGEINNLIAVSGSCCATGGGGTTGIFFTQSNVPGATAYACP